MPGRAGKRRRPYECSSLVVVDEVGYTPIDREECNLFYQFVAMRYEKIEHHHHLEQGFRRVERALSRSGDSSGDPGQAAAPQRGSEHQGQQLPTQGKAPGGP